jgi:hypothetical protein
MSGRPLLAWLSYRGAVHAAIDYGNALLVLVDLNHGTLLERFGVHDAPQDPIEKANHLSRIAMRSND